MERDETSSLASYPASWPVALRRYLAASAAFHVTWEVAQLPLYTITAEPLSRQAFAVIHCTVGDVMIAALSLLIAFCLLLPVKWPNERRAAVMTLTALLGIAYTIYSEWLNVSVRGAWAYGPFMPTLPLIGTGLTPLLQWMVVPPLALAWATRSLSAHGRRGQ